MPKMQVNATELVDTDVSFVSMVKHAATRIPFRITKQEGESMFDLSVYGRKLFKGESQAIVPAAIVGAVVQKGANMTAIGAFLTEIGLPDALQKAEQGNLISLLKADAPANEITLVKMSEDFALAVTGLKKSFYGYDYESTDFATVMGSGSFCSGINTALDMVQTTISNIMDQAKTPEEAAKMVGEALDACKEYVVRLAGGLPVKAFKADNAIHAMVATTEVMLKAEEMIAQKHPNHKVALAVAHAAHAAANTAHAAATMVTPAANTDANGTQGDDGAPNVAEASKEKPIAGKGKVANQPTKVAAKKAETASNEDTGSGDTDDDEDNGGSKAVAKAADAGKNGTGAGVELGQGTGTNPTATHDDAANTAVGNTDGDSIDTTGLDKMLGKTRNGVQKGLSIDPDKDGDDDTVPTGFTPGKGTAFGMPPSDSDGATSRGTADDKKIPKTQGQPGGDTLEHEGIPAQVMASTQKNEGDANLGKKGKGKTAPADESGAGAQTADGGAQDPDDLQKNEIMQAIAGLQKSFTTGLASVRADLQKQVGALGTRLDTVAEQAKKTDAALRGTVFNETIDDGAAVAKKSETYAPPLLDTALSRRFG